ncbi:Ger(x)C family spore germination protein [Bacillus sp. AK031]
MNRIPFVLILISGCLLLSSCVETRYLEKQGLITAVGYDQSEEDRITGTLVFYQFNPSMQNLSTVISGEADTSKGIRKSANMETDHNLVSGQLRVALYGEEIAKKGISSLVDSLTRDASIGNMVFLAVADPSAKEILSFQPKSQPSNMGTYLYNLMQLNVKSETIPNPTLQEFLTSYGSIGKDAILPYLSIIEGKVGITGFALFSDDKQVSVLEREKVFYIRSLLNRISTGSVEVSIPKENLMKEIKAAQPEEEPKDGDMLHVMLDNINSSHKIEVSNKNKPAFDIRLKLELRVLEMSAPLNLSEEPVLRKLEDELTKAMTTKGTEILYEIQETGSDPVGFGTYYRAVSRGKEVTKENWKETYPEAEFTYDIDVKIVRTGVID